MAIENAADIKIRFTQLQKIIQQDPKNIPAYLELADIFRQVGNHNQALQILSHALGLAPGNAEICRQLTPLLGQITPSAYHPELDHDIRECLQQELIDQQQLANLTATHLLLKHFTNGFTLNATLANDGIFLRFLTRIINIHPQMEALLVELRATLLSRLAGKNDIQASEQNLICALALQAFANEYIWPVSPTEETLITQLLAAEKSSTDCLLVAMYKPLHQFAENIALLSNDTGYPLRNELFNTTISEINTEQELINSIPSLSTSDTQNISAQVRAQYEQNPYPRWRTPPAPAKQQLKDYLQQLPTLQEKPFTNEPLQLLVAGCGTGFEPIDLARMDSTLNITALDLSKASIAYGQRIAQGLGINNIHFVQGDILEAQKLNKQFDVINSTGVLHHMEDPEAGLRSLCAIIKPGGIMRISLYSELARKRIVEARNLIQQKKLTGSIEDIKKCRAMIFGTDKNQPLHDLIYSQDFYSTSGCRDLLFHVQEHRFTLLQIQSLIQRCGLQLVGFDAPEQAQSQFSREYPDSLLDLQKWHVFEVENPDTFAGMYQLWLQRV